MLTLYTIVRGFEGKYDRIQRNAIGSWLRLGPEVEVILFGDDEPGAAQFADEMGLSIYPVGRDEKGIPVLNSPLGQIGKLAQHDTQCFLNADIILLPDFAEALQETQTKFPRFLLSARRRDFELDTLLEFDRAWDRSLRRAVYERGSLRHKKAIDVFCTRGVDWGEVPPFAIGKTCWDNWMVMRALQRGAIFADATPVMTVIHQGHGRAFSIQQRDSNREIYRQYVGRFYKWGFAEAQWRLTKQGWEKLRG